MFPFSQLTSDQRQQLLSLASTQQQQQHQHQHRDSQAEQQTQLQQAQNQNQNPEPPKGQQDQNILQQPHSGLQSLIGNALSPGTVPATAADLSRLLLLPNLLQSPMTLSNSLASTPVSSLTSSPGLQALSAFSLTGPNTAFSLPASIGNKTAQAIHQPKAATSNASRGEDQGEGQSDGNERVFLRLARNRLTARARRERKKAEAEALTRMVSALKSRQKELTAAFEGLTGEARKKADKIVESFGKPPVACQFCTHTFETGEDLDEHISINHTSDVNARKQFYKDSETFGLSIAPTDAEGTAPAPAEEDATFLGSLSSSARRKRRLERNAASARLCRQRKKLYIESLRSQLPGLMHSVRALEAAIPEPLLSQIRFSTPLPSPDDLEDREGFLKSFAMLDGKTSSRKMSEDQGGTETDSPRPGTYAIAKVSSPVNMGKPGNKKRQREGKGANSEVSKPLDRTSVETGNQAQRIKLASRKPGNGNVSGSEGTAEVEKEVGSNRNRDENEAKANVGQQTLPKPLGVGVGMGMGMGMGTDPSQQQQILQLLLQQQLQQQPKQSGLDPQLMLSLLTQEMFKLQGNAAGGAANNHQHPSSVSAQLGGGSAVVPGPIHSALGLLGGKTSPTLHGQGQHSPWLTANFPASKFLETKESSSGGEASKQPQSTPQTHSSSLSPLLQNFMFKQQQKQQPGNTQSLSKQQQQNQQVSPLNADLTGIGLNGSSKLAGNDLLNAALALANITPTIPKGDNV